MTNKKNRYVVEMQNPSTGRFSRRSFLSSLGAAGVAATAGPIISSAQTAPPIAPMTPAAGIDTEAIEGAIPVSLRVNGRQFDLQIDPRATLLDCLRETISLTGTKKGCDQGACGACTVLVDGERINSCLALAIQYQGREIVTIEGLEQAGGLDPMQLAFIEQDGFQCGYCTPGQICSAVGMLREFENGLPSAVTNDVTSSAIEFSDEEIKERMSGNLCRCGAYVGICAAIREVLDSEVAV